mmetsp:Transcript_10305/g.26177  ORF Transcript_10305/g.26177 Transcript_10305/m.26177 type:complete len:184 (+) Transcript_10305:415-966(+)
MRQAAQGLKQIHDAGVTYKDLKCENTCFVEVVALGDTVVTRDLDATTAQPEEPDTRRPDGHPKLKIKLLDFNTSVCSHVIHDAEGTQLYTPQECFMGAREGISGLKRDVWSLGCMMYCLMFGTTPFYGESPIHLQFAVMGGEYQIPVSPAISEDAKAVLSAMLQADPGQRCTVADVLSHSWLA